MLFIIGAHVVFMPHSSPGDKAGMIITCCCRRMRHQKKRKKKKKKTSFAQTLSVVLTAPVFHIYSHPQVQLSIHFKLPASQLRSHHHMIFCITPPGPEFSATPLSRMLGRSFRRRCNAADSGFDPRKGPRVNLNQTRTRSLFMYSAFTHAMTAETERHRSARLCWEGSEKESRWNKREAGAVSRRQRGGFKAIAS